MKQHVCKRGADVFLNCTEIITDSAALAVDKIAWSRHRSLMPCNASDSIMTKSEIDASTRVAISAAHTAT